MKEVAKSIGSVVVFFAVTYAVFFMFIPWVTSVVPFVGGMLQVATGQV